MIKSLLGEDEMPEKEESKTSAFIKEEKLTEESEQKESVDKMLPPASNTAADFVSQTPNEAEEGEFETVDEIKKAIETGNFPSANDRRVKPFEVSRPIGQPETEKTPEKTFPPISPISEIPAKTNRELELEKKLAEIEAELLAEKESQKFIGGEEKKNNFAAEKKKYPAELEKQVTRAADLRAEKSVTEPAKELKMEETSKVEVVQKDFKPESKGETIRKSGLAWSAAIALFGSVVFMMVLGWFADLLLDSTPWGITAGIILGGVIGFIQFFRITSQIINPKPTDFEKVSLSSNLREAKPFIETGTKEEKAVSPDSDDKENEKKILPTKPESEKDVLKEPETGSDFINN
jgi:F0F1-type ATP synthase assembly protein I